MATKMGSRMCPQTLRTEAKKSRVERLIFRPMNFAAQRRDHFESAVDPGLVVAPRPSSAQLVEL